MDGRFAPSPTGVLHLGNLRTALVAWLLARSEASRFLLRFEDLDTASVRDEYYAAQERDLLALGLDWDDAPLRQRDDQSRYLDALHDLQSAGLTYRCWCSRREIREAAAAPNGPMPDGSYPGTCSRLTAAEISQREASDRPPALRIRAGGVERAFVDRVCGPTSVRVDDFVLRRGDGTPAYNLVVVVDDAFQGVQEVVRADDLLLSTPRQMLLADHLGLAHPAYAHVPLVLGPDGHRLAKRDGAVTLPDREELGETAPMVLGRLAQSLGIPSPERPAAAADLLEGFSADQLPTSPWTFRP